MQKTLCAQYMQGWAAGGCVSVTDSADPANNVAGLRESGVSIHWALDHHSPVLYGVLTALEGQSVGGSPCPRKMLPQDREGGGGRGQVGHEWKDTAKMPKLIDALTRRRVEVGKGPPCPPLLQQSGQPGLCCVTNMPHVFAACDSLDSGTRGEGSDSGCCCPASQVRFCTSLIFSASS